MTDPTFYCDPTALTAEERGRYQEFENLLSTRIESIAELSLGYALAFPMEPDNFMLIAEFVTYERRCCPFLSFAIYTESGSEVATLKITGPKGAKQFIQAELGLL